MSRLMDNEAKIKNAVYILMTIINDTAIPRNIRRAAMEALNHLRDTKYTPGVRAANAIGALEQVGQDPNMSLSARTKIWQVISILETVKD
ncbi:MAG: UPF0147 family protein [Desulfurococcaceae archaeon]|jgi:uncharacterized protein (UPF0147 family)|nr:UPF0147 family protein [Desulfurococcaceae archaeon]MCC6052663.1 UPF0147 family protein [Desulfurococcaceae archaeon]